MLGVIGRVGAPRSLLDLEPDLFIALLEGIAREDPARAEVLDEIYETALEAARPPAPQDRAERHRDIERVMRLFHG